jgi:uncharacterized protein
VRPLVSVFCRAPRPGRTKTRLTPPLRPEEAAEVSAALLLDVLDALPHPAYDLEACAAGADDVAPLAAIVPLHVPVAVQGTGDLGDRMGAAVAARLAAGRPAVVVTGADCPDLAPAHVLAALGALDAGADAAVCPSSDGGYALIALARPAPALFSHIPWSDAGTLAATRRRATEAGLRLVELAPVDDVDRHEDLVRLGRRLRGGGDGAAPRAPRTRAVLDRLGYGAHLTAPADRGMPARDG